MVIYFAGIDPGLNGSICIIDDNMRIKCLIDCPLLEIKTGKKKIVNLKRVEEVKYRVDSYSIGRVFDKYKGRDLYCLIEHAQSMPGQGISSAFNYGEGYGRYLGVLDAYGISYREIKPNVWKKHFKLNYNKDLSIEKALQVIPQSKKYINLKKHDGRAEALLLSIYAKDNRDSLFNES